MVIFDLIAKHGMKQQVLREGIFMSMCRDSMVIYRGSLGMLA